MILEFVEDGDYSVLDASLLLSTTFTTRREGHSVLHVDGRYKTLRRPEAEAFHCRFELDFESVRALNVEIDLGYAGRLHGYSSTTRDGHCSVLCRTDDARTCVSAHIARPAINTYHVTGIFVWPEGQTGFQARVVPNR